MELNKTKEVRGVECTEPMFQCGVDRAEVKLYRAAEDSTEYGSIVDSGQIREGQYLVFDGGELIANFQSSESIKAINFAIGWMECKDRYNND